MSTTVILAYLVVMLVIIALIYLYRRKKKQTDKNKEFVQKIKTVISKKEQKPDPLAELERGTQPEPTTETVNEVEVRQDVPGPLVEIPGVSFAKMSQDDRVSQSIQRIMETLDELKTDVQSLKTKPPTSPAVLANLAKARASRRKSVETSKPAEAQPQ
jgi:hypothetical protein